jgi:hypothetical protein
MLCIIIAVVNETKPKTTLHEKSSRDDLLSLQHQPEEKQVPARFTGPEGPTLLVPFRKDSTPDYMFETAYQMNCMPRHARSLAV